MEKRVGGSGEKAKGGHTVAQSRRTKRTAYINSRWNSHFRLLVIFGHVRRFFTIAGYRISARFPARRYFNDFAVFQSRISMAEPAVPVNFSSPPRAANPSPPLRFLFTARISRWTFSIRFRFTATRREVVRFTTFESTSLPHEESAEIPRARCSTDSVIVVPCPSSQSQKKKEKRNTRKFPDPKVERRQWIRYEVSDDCSNVRGNRIEIVEYHHTNTKSREDSVTNCCIFWHSFDLIAMSNKGTNSFRPDSHIRHSRPSKIIILLFCDFTPLTEEFVEHDERDNCCAIIL